MRFSLSLLSFFSSCLLSARTGSFEFWKSQSARARGFYVTLRAYSPLCWFTRRANPLPRAGDHREGESGGRGGRGRREGLQEQDCEIFCNQTWPPPDHNPPPRQHRCGSPSPARRSRCKETGVEFEMVFRVHVYALYIVIARLFLLISPLEK